MGVMIPLIPNRGIPQQTQSGSNWGWFMIFGWPYYTTKCWHTQHIPALVNCQGLTEHFSADRSRWSLRLRRHISYPPVN
jgi:hypothetical protein